MLKVSVIIPTFRPGTYIDECLQSVFNQTLDPTEYEIIVILNGPKYPFYEKLNKLRNIKLYYSEKPSVSNARNIGLENAIGEYICFIDDDDVISSAFLSNLLVKANNNNMVISNVYSFIRDINEKRNNFFICEKLKNKHKYSHKSLFINRSFLAFPVARLIHRDIINHRRFDLRFKNGEDALFITTITDNIKDICFADEAIYFVRERVGSATRRKIPKIELLNSTLKLISAYISIYLKNPFKYSFLLFLSRIPGVIKSSIALSKNK